ncbi:hypothetical protein CDAR_460871 [Caerostris darwini]|uniref:Uncharacterized protein n=1 Tax=Caerostris darwini TaxID=1538125 RepID=A0AAV4R600_9ARAC|nr:hypothetical protein CDAR_460871 [Caerostris darwini]
MCCLINKAHVGFAIDNCTVTNDDEFEIINNQLPQNKHENKPKSNLPLRRLSHLTNHPKTNMELSLDSTKIQPLYAFITSKNQKVPCHPSSKSHDQNPLPHFRKTRRGVVTSSLLPPPLVTSTHLISDT